METMGPFLPEIPWDELREKYEVMFWDEVNKKYLVMFWDEVNMKCSVMLWDEVNSRMSLDEFRKNYKRMSLDEFLEKYLMSRDELHKCLEFLPEFLPRKRKLQEDEVEAEMEAIKQKKPAARAWDTQLDAIIGGVESIHGIEVMIKKSRKIAGHLKKKIVSELASLRKTLVSGLTQAKEAIQSMFTSKASGSGSSGHAAIQEHFHKLWSAISRLGMLELTAKAYSKGLITPELQRMVFSTNGTSSEVKAEALLSAIQERIKIDPSAFDVFVEILRSEPAYQPLADMLTSDLLC